MENVSRWKWHVRGKWNTREDRIPSAVYLGVLWVGMALGFGMDARNFLHQNPPLALHLHAAVFTIWMFLLTAQVLFVVRNRVDLHRRLGWLLVAWACLMAVMGPVADYTVIMAQVRAHGPIPVPFEAIHVVDVGGFLLLLALGIARRRDPATHKRFMILSTVALADPGFSRLIGYAVPAWNPQPGLPFFIYFFNGNILLVSLMLGWDFYRGRLIRSHVIASISLLAFLYIASAMLNSKPWADQTLQWVTAWAK
ncbi:hypothetical protein P8935_12810 [Telmatobacter sp. DSM 110680]|uniref:Uncharacterized protein n=1 Tax=Telmatobacter sp. DSM 110680 TaxID=3036704 RepID=A0AAU7DDP1_9BACT